MTFRGGLTLGFLVLFGASSVNAQRAAVSPSANSTPKWEVSGGYAFLRTRTVSAAGCCFNMNGGSLSVAGNLNSWFSVVGDFGGYYTGNVLSSNATLSVYTYTFGPRVSIRKSERITPYFQGLFGAGHAGGTLYTRSFQQGTAPPSARNAFAMIVGGGLDVNVNPHFAVRLVQADWLFTEYPNGITDHQHNLRITTGFVFRWGK